MDKLNPGIVKTVKMLNDAGYTTTDSGDGETHDYECDRDVGYVVVVLKDNADLVQECHNVARLLFKHCVYCETTQVCGSYDPANGLKLIDIHNITDKMLVFV